MPDKQLETTIGARLAAQGASSYLVVGASPLQIMTQLAEAARRVTVIDIRQEKLDKIRQRVGDGLDTRLVDKENEFSIFRDRSFGCVVYYDVLHHFPGKERVVAETRRILEDGGTAFFAEPNISSKWQREYDQFGELKDSMYKGSFLALLRRNGFRVHIHTYNEFLPGVRKTNVVRHVLRKSLQGLSADPLFRILVTAHTSLA